MHARSDTARRVVVVECVVMIELFDRNLSWGRVVLRGGGAWSFCSLLNRSSPTKEGQPKNNHFNLLCDPPGCVAGFS